MLIPKEKPYLIGLNSYYLYFEKFIEHLQGEIGSGCLYCQSPDQEILVYFYESDIIRAVTQNNGEHAQVSHDLKSVVQVLSKENFLVTVFYLDSASIFYWAELPAFQRKKAKINVSEVTLPNLTARLLEKKFSGFIDIEMENQSDSAMLFFHHGERRGGSYSWGEGGLSTSEDDYNHLLLSMENTKAATFDIGRFIDETMEDSLPGLDEGQYLSDLDTAIHEFLDIYIQIVKKKMKTDPIVQLKQEFLDTIHENHILDPFKNFFELHNDGTIEFAPNVNRIEITQGIVDCTWQVIRDHNVNKKFRVAVDKWDYKIALEERGITVMQ
jgi:hypothetical protein